MRTNESGAVVAGHLNFHHLQYFWAVATGGNLTRTAQALRVSQSAVSAQIRQLEAQLGEPLFHR
jgi:LysR family transcriptional activator of nhaA